MQFNVAQLLKEGVGSRRSYSLDESFEALQETGTTRAWGKIVLTCTDKGIWVSGPVDANAFSPCSRCLNPSEHLVHFRFDEEYSPTVGIDTGAPTQVPEEREGTFTIDSHHILDLAEAVRQHVIVSLPMKPLCHQRCAGLCLTCGANLNEGRCVCSAHTDSRWSPLLNLLTARE